ncbi:hypothetical protein E4U45_002759 [Claviceps purpurea]|nr:hypothetical protein E4U45_002759 [Claviceps purpurea]
MPLSTAGGRTASSEQLSHVTLVVPNVPDALPDVKLPDVTPAMATGHRHLHQSHVRRQLTFDDPSHRFQLIVGFAAGPAKTNTTNWSSPAIDVPDSNASVVDIRPADQLRQEEVETIGNRDSTSNVTGGLRSSTCFAKAILEI